MTDVFPGDQETFIFFPLGEAHLKDDRFVDAGLTSPVVLCAARLGCGVAAIAAGEAATAPSAAPAATAAVMSDL
ncbi:hypothetical protein Airi02_063660 [Actinoallomurus iriomotensis]|uniref:Uncharacterized protein n=1 Tax=Actinoallomurus iriomotensis TaxID=478107 RepID=A0A9W6SA15_9ACTN|nr:hypothetical protein Airi02_063660 [Actinoallomurus iriomotensis]